MRDYNPFAQKMFCRVKILFPCILLLLLLAPPSWELCTCISTSSSFKKTWFQEEIEEEKKPTPLQPLNLSLQAVLFKWVKYDVSGRKIGGKMVRIEACLGDTIQFPLSSRTTRHSSTLLPTRHGLLFQSIKKSQLLEPLLYTLCCFDLWQKGTGYCFPFTYILLFNALCCWNNRKSLSNLQEKMREKAARHTWKHGKEGGIDWDVMINNTSL